MKAPSVKTVRCAIPSSPRLVRCLERGRATADRGCGDPPVITQYLPSLDISEVNILAVALMASFPV